jgi:flagellar protein FlaJ
VSNNYYGKRLNREIKYIFSEIEYGKTFYDALNDSAKRINNLEISEVLLNINNVLKSGGDLSNLLDTLSESIRKLEMIKKEKLSQLKLTTYTYYGLYLGVLLSIIAVYYLIINIKLLGLSFNKDVYYELINAYKFLSFLLLLINAIFTGLVIGKLAKGTIRAGIIHSIVLTVISVGFFFLL